MRRTATFALAAGLALALTPSLPGASDSPADVAAIKQATQGFVKAVEAGDAPALAAYWTEQGEYYAEDGTTIRGRAAIEKAYASLFANKKTRIEGRVEMTALRFPSRDTAIQEGYFTARRGDAPVTTKYSILHVREDGKWLMAVVREWPSEGASTRDLAWLIGTWTAKNKDTEITTSYGWWGDKTFLRVHITMKSKDKTSEGVQMIGRDASTGQLRSWMFDKEGGFGEATWSRDGKKWTMDFSGVVADGSILTATNILTRIDDDTFTFQSVERTMDGEDLPDIPPVRVSRVKGK